MVEETPVWVQPSVLLIRYLFTSFYISFNHSLDYDSLSTPSRLTPHLILDPEASEHVVFRGLVSTWWRVDHTERIRLHVLVWPPDTNLSSPEDYGGLFSWPLDCIYKPFILIRSFKLQLIHKNVLQTKLNLFIFGWLRIVTADETKYWTGRFRDEKLEFYLDLIRFVVDWSLDGSKM